MLRRKNVSLEGEFLLTNEKLTIESTIYEKIILGKRTR